MMQLLVIDCSNVSNTAQSSTYNNKLLKWVAGNRNTRTSQVCMGAVLHLHDTAEYEPFSTTHWQMHPDRNFNLTQRNSSAPRQHPCSKPMKKLQCMRC